MPKKVKPGIDDLYTVRPDLMAEWDWDLNKDIDPHSIMPGTNKKAWFKCSDPKCGRVWYTAIGDRAKGCGCPSCAKNNVKQGAKSLKETHPMLAAEWNHEKNGNLTPDMVTAGSHKRVWWTCSVCGHEWATKIHDRKDGTGCPKCNAERQTSFPEQAILFYAKQLPFGAVGRYTAKWFSNDKKGANPELDVYIPTLGIGIEYDGRSFHTDSKKDDAKTAICSEYGVSLFRIREPGCAELHDERCFSYDLDSVKVKSLEPAIAAVLKAITKLAKADFHVDVNIERDRIAIYNQMDLSIKKGSLASTHPDIAAEWDYEHNGSLTPDTVTYGSGKKVWWICPECGMSYEAKINHRTNGHGHTVCAHRKGAIQRWATQKNLSKATAA